MAESRTLFSLLMGLPWWISVLVGVMLFGITQLIFPPVAPFMALPFVVLAAYIGYRQMRIISPGVADARLKALRAMSWEEFSAAVVGSYRRQGYAVVPSTGSGHDYALTKQGRTTLLSCRRWKVSQLGVGPLEELAAAITREDAYNGACLCAGDVSAKAREFAASKPITITTGAALATLVGAVGESGKRWFER